MPGNAQPSQIIFDILIAAGVGVAHSVANANDWHIGMARQRATPDKFITIYDTTGLPPEPALNINYPGIQIVVRSDTNNYTSTYSKSSQIRDVLLGRPSEVVLGDILTSITMPSDIISLGVDENERFEMALNFLLVIEQGDLSESWRREIDPVVNPVWVETQW